MNDSPEQFLEGISRRGVLAGVGAMSVAALFAQLGIADPAFAATIGDPWATRIRLWNWDWMGHRSNGSLGGQDYDFDFGEAIYAPAAGTLGAGTASSGLVRFTLDSTVPRLWGAEVGESGDTLASLEFLHLSAFGTPGHYSAGGGPIAYVGNTGVNTAHLHVHGKSTNGSRVDWRKFVSGLGALPLILGRDMYIIRTTQAFGTVGALYTALVGFKSLHHLTGLERDAFKLLNLYQIEMTAAQFQMIMTALQIPLSAAVENANYDGN